MKNRLQVKVNIENVIKLKAKGDKEAPFIVVLKNREERNLLLKRAKDLRDSREYSKVFINADQTQAERYNSKLLRDEAREKNDNNKDKDIFYYGIRNDKVVRIKK